MTPSEPKTLLKGAAFSLDSLTFHPRSANTASVISSVLPASCSGTTVGKSSK